MDGSTDPVTSNVMFDHEADADAHGSFVDTAGDTMTGALTVPEIYPTLTYPTTEYWLWQGVSTETTVDLSQEGVLRQRYLLGGSGGAQAGLDIEPIGLSTITFNKRLRLRFTGCDNSQFDCGDAGVGFLRFSERAGQERFEMQASRLTVGTDAADCAPISIRPSGTEMVRFDDCHDGTYDNQTIYTSSVTFFNDDNGDQIFSISKGSATVHTELVPHKAVKLQDLIRLKSKTRAQLQAITPEFGDVYACTDCLNAVRVVVGTTTLGGFDSFTGGTAW